MRLIFILVLALPCWASDIYFAQSSAGSNNGTNCANAYSQTRFNTADSNWTAGNTLHLCGTITSVLIAQASGSSGNPITIKFETGAVMTSAAWPSTGALVVNGKNYITIDGGTNGIIQNTANGQSLANQVESQGVVLTSCDTVTVKNLSVLAMYVKTQNVNSAAGASTTAISVNQCNNVRVTANTTTDAQTAIGASPSGSSMSNIEIDHNSMTNCNRCVVDGVITETMTTVLIHDNDFGGGAYLWDEPDNSYHHNAIHSFNTTSGHIEGLQEYNNYVHGIWGADPGNNHTTSMFFLETLSNTNPIYIYNNLLVGANTDSMPTNGFIFCKIDGVCDLFNNTMVGVNNGSHFGTAVECNTPQTMNIENNIIEYMTAYYNCNWNTMDYNIYNSVDAWDGSSTFAAWQGRGFDAHGLNASPNLNASYVPNSGSNAIGAGVNLTSISITPLDSGAPATFGAAGACGAGCLARPGSGGWDVGAYPFSAGASAPTVTTTTATSTGPTTCSSGGTVTSDGGASVTSEGVAYGLSANPDTSGDHTSDGTSSPFTSSITGLSASTTYHIRAYAINSAGTGYGSDATCTTTAVAISRGTRGGSFVSGGTHTGN